MSDTAAAETPDSRPARKRTVVIGAGVAAAALLVGAGAFAYGQLSGGGTQPHDVLPDSVIAYARIDLDPSAEQKVAMLRLIRKFPALADEIGIKDADQDVRRLIVDEATQGCDIDFDTDVEPWLGSRVGIGALRAKDVPDPVFALQVSDEEKARSGLRALEKCGDASKSGIAFLDGYALVAETQTIADRAKKGAVAAPLADDETFTNAMSDLGDEGVASAWVDVKSLFELPELKQELPEELVSELASGSAAVTVRAESDSLVLAAVSDGLPEDAEAEPIDIGTLPSTTAAAIGIRAPAKTVRDQWTATVDAMKAAGDDTTKELEAFETETGLRLPEDLETLFSGGLTIVVGERNLETVPTLEGPPDPSDFDIGVRIGDPDAEDLAERLIALVRDNTGLELSSSTADSGTVIATNDKTFSDSGDKLADSGSFDQVVGDDTQQVLYLNVATVVDALSASNPPPDIADVLDQMKPLGALGLTFAQDGDTGRGNITLSFRE